MKKLTEIISEIGMPENLRSALGWTIVHSVWQGILIVLTFSVLFYFFKRSGTRYWLGIGALATQTIAALATFMAIYQPAAEAVSGTLSSSQQLFINTTLNAQNLVNPAKLSFLQQTEIFLYNNLDMFVTFWMVGACFLLVRLVVGFSYTQGLKVKQVTEVGEEIQAIMDELMEKMPMKRTVKLLESVRAALPMTIGWLKPVILLPVGIISGMSARQLEAVLAHELAHIRRNDYLINIFQSFIEILFFYHPATWFISAKVRDERENCCDDFAVEICGDRLILAKALTQVASYRHQPQFAMAFGAKRSTFMDRIKRIVGINEKKSNYSGNITAIVAFVMVMVAGIAFAKKEEDKKKEEIKSRKEIAENKEQKSVIEKLVASLPFTEAAGDTVTIEVLEKEMQALGKEMEKYGEEMRKIGDQMSSRYGKEMEKSGSEMEKVGKRMGAPARNIEKLSLDMQEVSLEIRKLEMKYRDSKMPAEIAQKIEQLKKNEAEVQRQMRASEEEMHKIQEEMIPLQRKMNRLQSPMDSLGRAMEKFSRPMDSLGKIMSEKGKIMEKLAKEDEAKFKKELSELSEMLYKDGLIKDKSDFEIRLKGDKLLIDLQPQSQQVYDKVWGWMSQKWSKRYSGLSEKDLTIKVDGNNVHLNMKGGRNYYRSVGFVPPVPPVAPGAPLPVEHVGMVTPPSPPGAPSPVSKVRVASPPSPRAVPAPPKPPVGY
ncbi:M48 family metalloprotease [Emticicia sp. CRIBPO]|uniref:M56 family metallopeptidase n=1 Tax=Emticicia sp. CRIBPO TaxID=2683258 RepID=UPI0014120296|nr:M56 family metallopeptidase [Emticicia sp. CRIBPO]NBA87921.1 M48 family metalloprotease [Emticicia sp. CRIBPO]